MTRKAERFWRPGEIYPLVPVHGSETKLNMVTGIRGVNNQLIEIVLREDGILLRLTPGEGSHNDKCRKKNSLEN